MKYSFKEKQNHFRALRAEQHALADLALLEQKAPALPQLRKFKLLPVRYADEILYALLDVCSREEVVSHRRTVASEEEAAAGAAIEAKEELEALQAEHEELQSEHEDLQSEHEELENQIQELEETNEQLQEELKEEKKKELLLLGQRYNFESKSQLTS